jgi:hypothetical protein
MSIKITSLLQLAHDLSNGRKRRSEWEANAWVCEKRGPIVSAGVIPALDNAEDTAEMKLLQASLNAQGLVPRAPDAEHAMLRLLCADARSRKTTPEASEGQGCDFEWLACCGADTERAPPAETAQGPSDILCPVKSKEDAPNHDEVFAKMTAVGCEAESLGLEDAADVFAPPEVAASSEGSAAAQAEDRIDAPREHAPVDWRRRDRLPRAIKRLQELLHGCQGAAIAPSVPADARAPCSPDTASDMDSDTVDDTIEDASDDTADFVDELVHDSMAEAERQELAELLTDTALAVDLAVSEMTVVLGQAVATHCQVHD